MMQNILKKLTRNVRHCERSEAIHKCRHRKDWIATPPTEARNDVVRKSCLDYNNKKIKK